MSNRLLRYVGAICAVGLLLVAASLPSAMANTPEAWVLVLVLVLCALADLPLLETRFGHSVEAYTFGELFLMVSLVLVDAPTLVVLAAVATLGFHLVTRSDVVKAGFNAASAVIGAAIAGAVASGLSAGPADGIGFADAPGLVAAAVAAHLWNGLAVSGAMARAQGVATVQLWLNGAATRTLIAAGNIVVGIAVVAVGALSPRALLFMPPVLITLYVLYRAYLRAMQERDVWRQLEAATRELNLLDELGVAGAALRRALQLFRADRVELVLDVPGSGSRTFTLEDEQVCVRDAASVSVSERSTAYHMLDAADEDSGVVTCLVAPLDGPQGRLGSLRLIFNGPVKLSGRERQVLRTFAHSAGSSLQNVALYGEMRQHAEAMAFEASHDALTGLGNRVLLHERAVDALEAASDSWQCGLLIVDLDHFKEINDTLGHAAGDVFLQQVGQRIVHCVTEALAVCRLGGDEFAVLVGGLRTPEHADAIAARMLEVLAQPVAFDGLRLSIEGSVGVACYPADASSFEELLQRADVALYQAKDSRGSFSHYRVERDESSLHRLALAAELRTALSEDQLVVHFQPQFDLATGAPVGAEALVRWQHPRRGLLAPDAFVSAVEHSGLVRDFTLAVLEKAVAECASWDGAGARYTVAVNLSARNLLDSELPLDVGRVLMRHGLSAERLVLEITETTMMSELDVVEEVLGTLRAMGVQLSVDDFGTGYSSLAFLQRVAVNEVKIDRTFVAGVVASKSDRALVRATVQLAHSLGARAVGEGVENEELESMLRELGCDFAQGYHLGRPMTAEAMRSSLGLTRRRRGSVPAPRTDSDERHLRAVVGH